MRVVPEDIQMTTAPCYGNGEGCPRRCVGCRADCEDWKAWEKIHAEEKAAADRARHEYADAESFMSETYLRQKMDTRRRIVDRRNGRRK